MRRKIRLTESHAKCCYLKKWPVKGLCGRLEGQEFTKLVENINRNDCISIIQTLLNTSKDDIKGFVSF